MDGILESITKILVTVDDYVWGIPLIVLLVGSGIFLTARLKGLQIRRLPLALKNIVRKDTSGSEGDVSSFGALCTALSATIGTGNIVGVATAICLGGPGALFWMWFAALFGMATKYAECMLAVKYRKVEKDGHIVGGPFYYIEKGMGPKWKWLAKIFAVFGILVGVLGIGTFSQVNSISSAVQNFFDPEMSSTVNILGNDYSWATIIAGLLITFFAMLVIIGGIKRISKVAELVVPFMAGLYVLTALIIIFCNITKVPGAIAEVVQGAFGLKAAAGGALGAMIVAMQKGVARGVFSNEAGLGSAPIAASAAKTNEPVRQGLVSMTGTFFDTIIICTMTGLSIVITGAWKPELGLEGVEVTSKAFADGLPFPTEVSSFILMLCLVFFAFTTILGWNYYSERCMDYLTNGKKTAVTIFRWIYIAAIFIGPYMTISAVWTLADIVNGLMAIPNLIALIALSGVVVKETNAYFDKQKALKKVADNHTK